jgi:hypothetical protein
MKSSLLGKVSPSHDSSSLGMSSLCCSVKLSWFISSSAMSAPARTLGDPCPPGVPISASTATAKLLGWDATRSSSMRWLSCTTVLLLSGDVRPACSRMPTSEGPSSESPSS